MTQQQPHALSLSRTVLRGLTVLNLMAGVLILALLISSFVAESWTMTALGVPAASQESGFAFGMRAIMLVGLAGIPLTHAILTRLSAMVETVRAGDPFVAANAVRLQRIAWSALGLKLLNVVVTSIAASIATATNPIGIKWRLDVTGWLVVLLLFVLAGVFEHGTRMRDDLEGTV
jgi:hypothetical protein